MNHLSAEDTESVLNASLSWSNCRDCQTLASLIEETVRVGLSVPAECVIRTERRTGPEDQKDRTASRASMTRIVERDNDCLLKIVSRRGSKLTVSIHTEFARLPERDLQYVRELGQHMTHAFQHADYFEALKKTLDGLIAKKRDVNNGWRFAGAKRLTCREQEVVERLSEGHSNAEIATAMDISRRTVEKHLESVYRKLGFENRYQAITELTR